MSDLVYTPNSVCCLDRSACKMSLTILPHETGACFQAFLAGQALAGVGLGGRRVRLALLAP